MSQYVDAETHAIFQRNVRDSDPAVVIVVRWLRRLGHNVTKRELRIAPTHADYRDYSDEGDLDVDGQRVEVKGLTSVFTGAHDWPHRWGFLVCTKHSYDLADPKPICFFMLNKARTHAGMVESNTFRRWKEVDVPDGRPGFNGRMQRDYLAPLDCVFWYRIGDPLWASLR